MISSPAMAGCKYSIQCERATQPMPSRKYRSGVQPRAAECASAASCIQDTYTTLFARPCSSISSAATVWGYSKISIMLSATNGDVSQIRVDSRTVPFEFFQSTFLESRGGQSCQYVRMPTYRRLASRRSRSVFIS